MAKLSHKHLDRHQISEPENSSAEILKILNNFIVSRDYILKPNKEKNSSKQKSSTNFLLNVSSNKLFFFLVSIFLLLPPLMVKLNISEAFIILIIKILGFLIVIFFITRICNDSWERKKTAQETIEKAIFRAGQYKMHNYYHIREILGSNFKPEDLKKEEIRFKVITNQRKKYKELLNKSSPALAILLVIIGIAILGIPNYDWIINQFSDSVFNILFGGILSFTGFIKIIQIGLDYDVELRSRDLYIYEQCILILQKAQNIAKEIENKRASPSINKNTKKGSLMEELIKIKTIEAPEDFSTNFDSYIGGDRGAGRDIH